MINDKLTKIEVYVSFVNCGNLKFKTTNSFYIFSKLQLYMYFCNSN